MFITISEDLNFAQVVSAPNAQNSPHTLNHGSLLMQKIKLAPQINSLRVPAWTKMYLVLDVGLLLSED